jgi:hypothetical protein
VTASSFFFSGKATYGSSRWMPTGQPTGEPKVYFVMKPFSAGVARFSPEPSPHWIAYQSNESGRDEIYIQGFPVPQGKIQVSTGGGRFPEWSPNGRELFYVTPDFKLMAVDLRIKDGAVEPATPIELFRLPAMDLANVITPYAVADANKFLVRNAQQQLINLIIDWPADHRLASSIEEKLGEMVGRIAPGWSGTLHPLFGPRQTQNLKK